MSREQTARSKHKNGNNCAVSVHSSFFDRISGVAPTPRSEGGKCGALLAGEKVLSQMGLSTEAFDQEFLQLFGSLKCSDLRKTKIQVLDEEGIIDQVDVGKLMELMMR